MNIDNKRKEITLDQKVTGSSSLFTVSVRVRPFPLNNDQITMQADITPNRSGNQKLEKSMMAIIFNSLFLKP